MNKTKSRKVWLVLALIIILILVWLLTRSCRRQGGGDEADIPAVRASGGSGAVLVTFDLALDFSKHKVTFIEIGADRCIPCQAMQPIMREIAEEYAGRIQVVFYDVWKDPRPARHYGIQLIPTQVFIDQNGREIFRHVGLFPKEEILHMLQAKGIL